MDFLSLPSLLRRAMACLYQGLLWRIEFIILPIRHVVFDIIRNAVHFRGVTNDVVVETGLPGEIEGVLVGETGNRLFKTSNGC